VFELCEGPFDQIDLRSCIEEKQQASPLDRGIGSSCALGEPENSI
jgi:hypothetical protein